MTKRSMDATYCGRCGKLAAEGGHAACTEALVFEPPRYCAQCARRLVVQVTPTTWTSHCSRHPDVVIRTSAPPPA